MKQPFSTTNFYEKSEQIGCTQFEFGEYELLQLRYECSTCMNDSICLKCIKICHIDCKTNISDESPVQNHKFICSCATKQSHNVKPIIQSASKASKCNLLDFDIKINISYSYTCEDHNETICSFCYLSCHKDCTVIIQEYNRLEQESSCTCEHGENHLHCNHFIFDVDFPAYAEATKVKLDSKIQLVNILIDSGVLIEMKMIINKFLDDWIITQSIREILKAITRFSDKSEMQTGYNYVEIAQLFPYDTLIKFLNACVYFSTVDDYIVYLQLISILYYFHLKKDFKDLKNLSVSDFATSSIMSRLHFRKLISNKNTITAKIQDKYDKKFSQVKSFICNFEIKHTYEVMDHYHIDLFLKLVKFSLKRSLFDFEDFPKLVNWFSIFSLELIEKDIVWERYNDPIKLKYVKNLIEILFMMCINYNDLQIGKYLSVKESENKIKLGLNFLQIKNDTTTQIMQMVIKIYMFILGRNLGYKWTILNEKFKFVFNLFNETLKLFTMSDNIYLKQIKHLQSEEGSSYFNRSETEDSIFKEFILNARTNLIDFFNFKHSSDYCNILLELLYKLSDDIHYTIR